MAKFSVEVTLESSFEVEVEAHTVEEAEFEVSDRVSALLEALGAEFSSNMHLLVDAFEITEEKGEIINDL